MKEEGPGARRLEEAVRKVGPAEWAWRTTRTMMMREGSALRDRAVRSGCRNRFRRRRVRREREQLKKKEEEEQAS